MAPRHNKEDAYKTLVRPQLEYVADILAFLSRNTDCTGGDRRCREQLPGWPAGDGEIQDIQVESAICWAI